jgi:hydroxyacylglutathione hydrolase
MNEIKTITVPFILGVSVNCYLVRTDGGHVLIDTGKASQRGIIEKEIESAGCRPGDLDLIILTHGDFDHCGNAAYLCEKFGAKVAMHPDDSGIVERGDMLWNRNQPNVLVRAMFGLLFRLSEPDRFKPDLYLEEGYDLSGRGFDARVLHIPGHSKGSIGILTADGDLFCGDLLANLSKPEVWSLIDDAAAMNASVEKVKGLKVNIVYPGHGKPFPMEEFKGVAAL